MICEDSGERPMVGQGRMQRQIPFDRLEGLEPGRGLTAQQAADRLRLHGPNDIVEKPPGAWQELVLDSLRDPMLWFLVGASVLYAFLGDRVEALTLACAVIPLIGMDAWLHRRTQASVAGLASRLASSARALRDGAWVQMPARDLVPGDLVEVGAGEFFPADGVIVAGANLQVDESTVSGESLPVAKQAHEFDGARGQRTGDDHWSMAGTRLLTGSAQVRIAWTGGETLYGGIVRTAVQGRHARTPMQVAIGKLVMVLLVVALLACLVLAAVRLHDGYGIVDALLSAVTLAVAAIPEEFPVVFTLFLAGGVYRLARRKALVRRAVAVENIGRISCICSDKTGTMTEGRLVLAHREPAAGTSAEALLQVAALASRPDSGDLLDGALLQLAPPAGADIRARIRTFPFTEARRCETDIWQLDSGGYLAVIKGAPETVLARSALSEAELGVWRARVEHYAATGHKVIACAVRRLTDAESARDEPQQGFAFSGLLAFEDPVRAGVREAVRSCAAAGIRIVMVTGDHPGTAEAIAREVGLGNGRPRVLAVDGPAQEELTADRVANVDVIARATPAQKLQLVRALQQAGEIVAVTGDGVNDVPALQAADVGIAMGERGTRSAREVAAIVLLDDNFRTIVGAVAEGRQLFGNLRASFAYLLMVHMPLVSSAAIVPLAGYPLLYLPIHIVWLELLIHPTALLAFQGRPPTADLARMQRARHAGFYGPRGWTAILLTGGLVTLATLLSYRHGLGVDTDADNARTMARTMAIAVLVFAGATITAILSGLRAWSARIIVAASILSLVVLVEVPVLAGLLHLHPPGAGNWMLAVAAGVFSGAASVLLRAGGDRALTCAPPA